jgi:RNA polymerase sigma-70 factor (ECF subfamily)
MRPTLDECAVEGSDGRIVLACLDGDWQKYSVLVRRHQAAVLGFLRGKLGGHRGEACEEITQETFVRAYRKLKSLRKTESFLPWLIGIADRVCRESSRADWRRKMFLAHQRRELEMRSAGPSSNGDGDVEIQQAVAELPEPYRHVVLMRFFQDLSCAEIAGQLDKPVGTITKILSRAYQMLRTDLTPNIHPPRLSAKEEVQS